MLIPRIVAASMVFAAFAVQSRPAAAQSCSTPPPGLLHWWPGEADVRDIQGGQNGVPQGPVAFAAGRVGRAFSLDDGARIDVPDQDSLNPGAGSFSVSAWAYK